MNRVLEILGEIRPGEDFASSSDFIEDGLLDSFDVITLVSELDKTYGISIDGTDIVPENFRSIGTIEALLRKAGAKP